MDAETKRSDVQTDTCNFTNNRNGGQEQQQANDKRIHHCWNFHCLDARYTYVCKIVKTAVLNDPLSLSYTANYIEIQSAYHIV